MATTSLPTTPVSDGNRSEFGIPRTSCGCTVCVTNCKFMPGYLVPADLRRIHGYVEPDLSLLEFAEKYLLASEGATVIMPIPALRGASGPARIPTLVPARNPDTGHCVFLQGGACSIHKVAPFGCAFFDCKTTRAEGDRRSKLGLTNLFFNESAGHPTYYEVWTHLAVNDLVAKSPGECRAEIEDALVPPLSPQTVAQMRARYDEAVTVVYDGRDPRTVTPGEGPEWLPENRFDFEDGMRLSVSLVHCRTPTGEKTLVLHLGAGVVPGTPAYDRLDVGPAGAPAALAAFVKLAVGRHYLISGNKSQAVLVRTTPNACHWAIEPREEDKRRAEKKI